MIIYVGNNNKYVPKGSIGEVCTNGYHNRDYHMVKFVLSNRVLGWTHPDDFGNKIEVTTLLKKKDCIHIIEDGAIKSLFVDQRIKIKTIDKPIPKHTYDFVKDQIGIVMRVEDIFAYVYWDRVGVIPVPITMVHFDDSGE